MNEMTVFQNPEFGQVRTITRDGEPWFVGVDVCNALGYSKARNAIAIHVDNDDKAHAPIQGGCSSGVQNTLIINESGLYALIFGSTLESAKRFKHWVTSEVLPSIRKTGSYTVSKYKPKATSVGEVVNLIVQTRESMERQGSSPREVAIAVKQICEQFGIMLPDCFVKPETFTMKDAMDMVDFVYSQPRGKGKRKPTYEDYMASRSNQKRLNGR